MSSKALQFIIIIIIVHHNSAMCQVLTCILGERTQEFGSDYPSCFANPPSCFLSHFFILLLSASIFQRRGVFVGAVGANTNTFEPLLC